jgi:very-long-chain ceramide synthase
LAKILKYLKFQKACDVAFGAFVVVWLVTRHILYGLVVYSIYRDLPNHIQFGCYKGPPGKIEGPFPPPNSWEYLIAPFKDPDGLLCQTQAMQNMFVGMLLFLQCILLLWFGMIVRVVIKVLSGHSAEDVRSDDEDEEDIEQQENLMKDVCVQGNYIEVPLEDVSVEMLSRANGKASPANRFRRANGNASGVSIPHDRKELLGRIGCDKQN